MSGCLDDDTVLGFVEGTLESAERADVAAHLDECAACRKLVACAAEAVLPTAQTPLTGASVASLVAGQRVGRYEVKKRLGSGAMGVVYAARDDELGRDVALKVARSDGDGDGQLRARLLREARAASGIRHPHVVAVHDVLSLDDGTPVIVMDLLEGETLRERLEREGSLSAQEATELGEQLLEALEAAHALGIVHRDLKPDNIFLERGSERLNAKIVDFGIAKLTAIDGEAAETAGLTATGMLVGTPQYMAPEQAFADEEIDARADLWAVGAVLYECVSGRRPIDGDHVGGILRRLARLEITPLSEVAPDVPRSFVGLVHTLLTERDTRPASATEVRRRLLGLAEAATGDRGAALPGAAGKVDTLQAHAAERRPGRYRSGVAWAVVLVAVVIAVGLGVFRDDESAAVEPAPSEQPSISPAAASPDETDPKVADPDEPADDHSADGGAAHRPSSSSPVAPPPRDPTPPATVKRLSPAANSTATGATGPAPGDTASGPGKLIVDPPF